MKERSNDYFVKINPQFLFNTQGIFKSYFTPWVYLYLKLEKNMLISKQIHNEFKINQKDLVEFFMVDRATIYRAIKELMNFGVLSKSGSKYRIFDEQSIINQRLRLNKANLGNLISSPDTGEDAEMHGTVHLKLTSLAKLPEFIQIYQNQFLKLRNEVLSVEEKFKDYPRSVIKIIEIYYYLIACNRHCLLLDIDTLESDETQTSISKNLNHDNRFTRAMLDVLHKIDYIAIYENGSMATIKKRISGMISQNYIGSSIEKINPRVEAMKDRTGYKEIIETDDTFDFANSFSGNQDKIKEVSKEVESIESVNQVAEEVTFQERLGYLFNISKGDVDKFINKASEGNIPEEEVHMWLQNNQAA